MHTVGRRRFFVVGICCVLGLAADEVLTARSGQTPAVFRWPMGKRAAVSLSFDDARTSQVDEDDSRCGSRRRTLGDLRRPRDRAEGLSDNGCARARAALCVSEGLGERIWLGTVAEVGAYVRDRQREAARAAESVLFARGSPDRPPWSCTSPSRPRKLSAGDCSIGVRHVLDCVSGFVSLPQRRQ
jgi:hypothetical protein